MADAVGAGGGVVRDRLRQLRDAAGFLAEVQVATGAGDEAGAVVAAVLEPLESVEEDRGRFAPTGETDDAAHAGVSLGWKSNVQTVMAAALITLKPQPS